MEYSNPKVSERDGSGLIDSLSSNCSLQSLYDVCCHCAKNRLNRGKKSTSSVMPKANSQLDRAYKLLHGEDFANETTTESQPQACFFARKKKCDALSPNPMALICDELDFLPVKNRSIKQNKQFWNKYLQIRRQDVIVSERLCQNRLSHIRTNLESWKSFNSRQKSRDSCVSSRTETELRLKFDRGLKFLGRSKSFSGTFFACHPVTLSIQNEDHARRRSAESRYLSHQRNRFGTESRNPLMRESRKKIHLLKSQKKNRIATRTAESFEQTLTPVALRESSNDREVDGWWILSSSSRSRHRKNKPMSSCIVSGSGSCFGLNKGNSVAKWNLDENNGASLSDGGVLPEVAEILQDNLCKERNRCTVETVLLEGKIDASATDSNPLSGEEYPVDNRATETKLLGEIKRRIDRDFELSLYANGESSRLRGTWKRSENAKPWIGVDMIDSGVSTDISLHESEPRKHDYDGRKEGLLPGDDQSLAAMCVGPDDRFFDDVIDEEVEKAVQRLTEELIMCERRAVERGLITDRGQGPSVCRNRKKPCRKAKHHNHGYLAGGNYAFSYRIRQPSSELEYLKNISPSSLCSVSDPSSTPRTN